MRLTMTAVTHSSEPAVGVGVGAIGSGHRRVLPAVPIAFDALGNVDGEVSGGRQRQPLHNGGKWIALGAVAAAVLLRVNARTY